MTYSEWIAKLKEYLASVSDEERKKVLDYYSEAYADRKENGHSEESIIVEFGPPYEAARRILDCDDFGEKSFTQAADTPFTETAVHTQPAQSNTKQQGDGATTFLTNVLIVALRLLVIAAFSLLTVVLFAADLGLTIGGISELFLGIGALFGVDKMGGLTAVGVGLISLGLGIVLFPWIKIFVKWMWRSEKKIHAWLKEKLTR